MEDITEKGPVGLKGLKGLDVNKLSDEQYNQFLSSISPVSKESIRLQGARQMGQYYDINTGANVGDSMFDQGIYTQDQLNRAGDIRAENQPWYAKIAAGLAKGAVLAGTTFLDGTIGLAIGLGTALEEGRFSGLWDNPFSQAMQSINKWSEQVLPNYYTSFEQEAPWQKNMFSANFIGDKFIKNLGFTVGAFYSGGVYSAAAKASKIPQLIGKTLGKGAVNAEKAYMQTRSAENLKKYMDLTKQASQAPAHITSGIGATMSALNEGRIEAINNSGQWFDYHKASLDDEHKSKVSAIYEQYGDSEQTDRLVAQAETEYQNKLANLESNKAKMGNMDLLMNIPILTAGNLVQFGRLYANGFKTARKASNIVKRAGETFATTKNLAKGLGRASMNALAEGTEELTQGMANAISGEFYQSRMNPDGESKVTDFIKAFGKGINETLNDNSSWEEFFIGSLTGALGIPAFGKVNTREAYIGKNKPVGIAGGIIGEYQNYREEQQREQEMVDYMNNRIQSPEFKNYYQGLIRHQKYQTDMDNAVEKDDDFEFKNAEHAQLVSDIMMFDNAGKLEDLLTLVNSAYDMSDDNLESIIQNTTSTIQNQEGKNMTVGPFIDENGNPLTSTPEGKQLMKDKLTQTRDDIFNTVNSYIKAKSDIDIATGQQLSDPQLEELTWLKVQTENWEDRGKQVAEEIKPILQSIGEKVDIIHKRTLDRIGKFNISGETDAELEELAKKQEEFAKTFKDLSQRENEDLANALTVPRIRKEVTGAIISATKDNLISADESLKLGRKVDDLSRLQEARIKFADRLTKYIQNPGLLADDIVKAEQEVVAKQADKIVEGFTGINTVKDLRKSMDNVDLQLIPAVMKSLGNSKDENLKKAYKNYEAIENAKLTLSGIFDTIEASQPDLQSAANIIEDSINSAETLDEAKTTINNALAQEEIPTSTKDVLNKVLNKMDDIKKSQAIDEEDKNVPKTKLKKKGSGTGIFGKMSDTKDVKDAGMEEEKSSMSKQPVTPTQESPVESKIEEETEEQQEKETRVELNQTDRKKLNKLGLTDEVIDSMPKDDLEKAKLITDKKDALPFIEKHNERIERQQIEDEFEESEIFEIKAEDGNAEVNSFSKKEDSERAPFLRNWHSETRWDFNELSNRETRRQVPFSSKISDALQILGAYSFVDSGKLGKLILKNPNTKVHYILSKDPALKDRILMGIEINDSVLKVIGKADNPIQIGKKTYQIIGTVGYNKQNSASQSNYEGIFDGVHDELDGYEGNYAVSDKFHNKIKHIYSGRMVKSTETERVRRKAVNKRFMGDTPFHLGFYYKDGDFRTPTIDQSTQIVEPLNTNNANPRAGSVWMMVQEADGVWYAKATQLKRFTESEYPLEENQESPIVKEIAKNLLTFVSPNSTEPQRLQARDAIEEILYFPKKEGESHALLYKEIKDNSGKTIDVIASLKGIEDNIGTGESAEDKALNILHLLQDERLNLRFQVSPGQMTNKRQSDMILDSEILTTDLYQPGNINASFDTYLNDLETGLPIVESDRIVVDTGHTGQRGVNNILTSNTVYSLGHKYSIDQNGVITDSKGNEIKDSNTINEINLSRQIKNGEIKPVEGSSLYLGYYNDGKEFGIIGKKLLKDNELKEYKDILIKKKKEKSINFKVKEVLKKAEQKPDNLGDFDDIDKDFFENVPEVTMFAPESKEPLPQTKPSNKIEKVIQDEVKEVSTRKKRNSKAPLISENFAETNVNTDLTNEGVNSFEDYLRNDFDILEKLMDKLGTTDIESLIDNINNRIDLPNIDTLTSEDQYKTLVDTILECR